MQFKVVNIGCKVNRVEVDAASAQLIGQGACMTHDADADIVIVNTCTVTAEADKKTRKAVRAALRNNPSAQLLVTGCAAVMNPEWFEELDARVHVVAKPEIATKAWELLETHNGTLPPGGPGDDNTLAFKEHDVALRTGMGFRTRVGIKVQDGCNNACTYCIVHVARGESWSVPFEQVVAEARAHALAGVRELVLTGINLGAYDDGGRTLADLLKALLEACPEARFRIGSVEPLDVSDELIALMAVSDGRICRHLHLPLQSGSSRVLAEMARPYDAAYFLALVKKLREAMPTISLSTDIIVGFPGETDEDFAETLSVARASAFSKIHVFRYSRREGTPAAERSDQVVAEVVAKRSRELQELGLELGRVDAQRRFGSEELVLVERVGQGTTESYHPVRWVSAAPAVGELARVRLEELGRDGAFVV
ncbi:MAG: tRNA (N(6)-L-threonylcarbamoyladenosine(37)-C(2))-methylthiotransferase MtaB [Coriobacteriia bacterium]|nr:tRNA (N(6)-L-threonylcarbamoyladenosine(37)-C(2))-methylthiotransferase MtaB [Coriobacteriia bacterium]